MNEYKKGQQEAEFLGSEMLFSLQEEILEKSSYLKTDEQWFVALL